MAIRETQKQENKDFYKPASGDEQPTVPQTAQWPLSPVNADRPRNDCSAQLTLQHDSRVELPTAGTVEM